MLACCRLRGSHSPWVTGFSGVGYDFKTACEVRILPNNSWYWTFLNDLRLPLANHSAERALRPYVLW